MNNFCSGIMTSPFSPSLGVGVCVSVRMYIHPGSGSAELLQPMPDYPHPVTPYDRVGIIILDNEDGTFNIALEPSKLSFGWSESKRLEIAMRISKKYICTIDDGYPNIRQYKQ